MALGIKESLEVENFLLAVGQAVAKSYEDKKLEVSDVLNFVGPLMILQPAIEGAGGIPAELKDLDAVEGMQLVDNAISKLPGLSVKVADAVKAGLEMVLSASKFYSKIKALKE